MINGASSSATQYSIRKPTFSPSMGYPSKVIFFQNRLWFARTKTLNNTLFGSKINQPVNFDVGTGQDTDAIIYTLGQSDSGGIVWMNGGKELEIYTANYEFVAPQEQNVGLTPGTFSIRQQSAYGVSAQLKPVSYLNDSYYVNKTGNAIINFRFQGIGQSYLASNVSQTSSHLVKDPIKAVLLRGTEQSQDNFIYFLNPDHTITTFQFAHEVNLAALTPFSAQKQIEILDMVAINNTIYLLKKYLTLPKTIDLVNASYSLPFIKPALFLDVWKNIVKHIRPGGLFTGNFFGPKDDYAHDKNITILDKSQLQTLFTKFKILYMHENKEYAVDSTGAK